MVSRIVKIVAAFCLMVGMVQTTMAQDTLRVSVYNILRYGAQGIGGCTPIPVTNRNTWFSDVLSEIQPDIFGVNEIGPIDGAFSPASNISLNVLPNVPGKGPFYQATQINFSGNQDICNMMYYNSQKVGLSTQGFINVSGSARNLDYYKFYYKSGEPIVDSAFIHIILVHYMASSGSARENQATAAMNALNSLGGGPGNYIIMGDMNLNSSNEAPYQIMANPSNPNIAMKDPINLPVWNQNYAYTQSTTSSTGDCRAGGGLNDRFDLILCSDALINNTLGMSYVPNSYWSVGNPHAPNPQLGTPAQIGIAGMSDHHPVSMDIAISQAVANDPAFVKPIDLKIESPFRDELQGQIQIPEGYAGTYQVRLLDLQGRVQIAQQMYFPVGQHRLELPLHNTADGLYFLEIDAEAIEPLLYKIVRMH